MSSHESGLNSQVFLDHRKRLFGLAYRMLGSVAEAEDIVQDAFLRCSAQPADHIVDAAAYLTTATARLAIDALRRRKREDYVGPWLPDPLCTSGDTSPEGALSLADDLTIATLMVLEELSPEERAAFLLHDVFDLPFAEIGALVGLSNVAARQHASRARKRLKAARIPSPPVERQDSLVDRFMGCLVSGDLETLKTLLTEDIKLVSDGGARGRAALRPGQGKEDVLDLLARMAWRWSAKYAGADFQSANLNSMPGWIVSLENRVEMTVSVEISGEKISAVYIMRNPDKMIHLTPNSSD